jgi:hypothetical protein
MALALDTDSGRAVLRVSRVLADPLSVIPKETAKISGIFAVPAFRALAPKALSSCHAGPLLAELACATRALPTVLSAQAQNALTLALAPKEKLDNARRFLAAGIHAPRLRAALLKSERDAMAALFGQTAFEFALREGTVFCHQLPPFACEDALTSGEFSTHPAAKVAHHVMSASFTAALPVAGLLYTLRNIEAPLSDLPTPDPQQIKQALRALTRGL